MNNRFEELESTFNWEYVHWVMEQINWTWDMNGEEQRVPTISEMKQCVRDLLQELTLDSTEISSGGFVLKRGDDDVIELHFMVA